MKVPRKLFWIIFSTLLSKHNCVFYKLAKKLEYVSLNNLCHQVVMNAIKIGTFNVYGFKGQGKFATYFWERGPSTNENSEVSENLTELLGWMESSHCIEKNVMTKMFQSTSYKQRRQDLWEGTFNFRKIHACEKTLHEFQDSNFQENLSINVWAGILNGRLVGLNGEICLDFLQNAKFRWWTSLWRFHYIVPH